MERLTQPKENKNSRRFFYRTLPGDIAQLLPLTESLHQELINPGTGDILVFHRDWTRPKPTDSLLTKGLIVRALKNQQPSNMITSISDSMRNVYIQDMITAHLKGYVVVMRVPKNSMMFRNEPNYRINDTTGSPIAEYNSKLFGSLPKDLVTAQLKSDEYYAHIPPKFILGFFTT